MRKQFVYLPKRKQYINLAMIVNVDECRDGGVHLWFDPAYIAGAEPTVVMNQQDVNALTVALNAMCHNVDMSSIE